MQDDLSSKFTTTFFLSYFWSTWFFSIECSFYEKIQIIDTCLERLLKITVNSYRQTDRLLDFVIHNKQGEDNVLVMQTEAIVRLVLKIHQNDSNIIWIFVRNTYLLKIMRVQESAWERCILLHKSSYFRHFFWTYRFNSLQFWSQLR